MLGTAIVIKSSKEFSSQSWFYSGSDDVFFYREMSFTGSGSAGPCTTVRRTMRTSSHSRRATWSWSWLRRPRTRTGWRGSWSLTRTGAVSSPAPSSTSWLTDHHPCHVTQSSAALSRSSRIMTASHITHHTGDLSQPRSWGNSESDEPGRGCSVYLAPAFLSGHECVPAQTPAISTHHTIYQWKYLTQRK